VRKCGSSRVGELKREKCESAEMRKFASWELKRDEEGRKREKCESARVAKCESWGIEEG